MAHLRSTHVAGDLSVSGNLKANLSIKIAGVTKTLDGSRILEWTADELVLKAATATEAGVVKLGSATVQTVAANAVSNTASRSYAVQVDSSGKMVVNVPWVDANTIYTHPTNDGNKHVPATGTTSDGKFLRAGATAGTFAWANIPTATADADGVVKLGSSTKITATVNTPSTTANRNYPIQLDSSGRMAVNVPWVDNNTVYTHPTTEGNLHIPSGGSAGQFLGWDSAGKAKWVNNPNTNTTYTASTGLTLTGTAFSVKYGTTTGTASEGNHGHSAATTSADGFMSAADKSKLNGIASGANAYAHPTSDGNKHVPATGTTNNGKVLMAGATAGSFAWASLPPVSKLETAGYVVEYNPTTKSLDFNFVG